jgi:uncharacterized protein (TIGR02246 family)
MSKSLTADDKMQIQELYARYSWAMDTGDLEALKTVFVEDCSYSGWSQVWAGRDHLCSTLIEFHHKLDLGVQHHAANFLFDGTGSSCVVTAMNYGFHFTSNGSTIRYVGYYVDNVVKSEGRWLFRKRSYAEWEGQVTVEGRSVLEALKKQVLE